MSTNTPYLQIRHISKAFGKVAALDDVSLDVRAGEFLFLLGPSGCGKTTLLRIIAGLEEPSAGQVLQAGADVTGLPPSRRDFGIVFQSYALFPNLTVAQNIAYGLESRRLPRSEVTARVAEMLALVGLTGYETRYPAQLSGGQQQRVALARALAISPGLLLLDEPLSALDARVRGRLRLEVAALQRRLGVTTIMVTHDQEEALTMADRVVVMERGRIVQAGAPREVYRTPATPFVADFVGLMNFLPGRPACAGTLRRRAVAHADRRASFSTRRRSHGCHPARGCAHPAQRLRCGQCRGDARAGGRISRPISAATPADPEA
jgi:iron(III) transport system ATP-binding protein